MTHRCPIDNVVYDPDECQIVRYQNNGIALVHLPNGDFHRSKPLFFLSGEDIGVTLKTPEKEAVDRATPILNTLLHTHNQGVKAGIAAGIAQAQLGFQTAMGLTNYKFKIEE